ncbi:retrovirus-related pol polyprotein from transposon TNT 1-94, partial [Trifolium medium]|nr:retrovirus-related pol polyprotein from transposon TNT 1-94 [Trifolium medium]
MEPTDMDEPDWAEMKEKVVGLICLCVSDEMDDEDKTIILLCSLPGSYNHLVTTLTYGKDSITLTSITSALLSHCQRRQNAEGGSQGEGLYVQGGLDRGRNKGKAGSGKKRSNIRTRKQQSVTTTNTSSIGRGTVQTDDSCSEGDILCVSSSKCTNARILDSGCSYHMTPNREWFTTF